MAVYRATVGRIQLTPLQIRRRAGISCPTGIGYLALTTAIAGLTDGQVRGTVRNGSPAMVRDYVMAGVPTIMSIAYGPLLGHACACEDDFRGGHGVYLNAYRVSGGSAQLQVGDPLADGRRDYRYGFGWCSASLFFEAALERGGGAINFVTFRDTEGREYTGDLDGSAIRATPTESGTKIGEINRGQFYYGRRTVNGTRWRDRTGRTGTGWVEILFGANRSKKGYVKGSAVL